MELGKIVMIILSAIVAFSGAVLLYDARLITKKMFGFGDQNEASLGLKILGFLLVIVGLFLIYFLV